MGCYTAYVVREPDGSVTWTGERWGPLELGPDALHAHVTAGERIPARPGFLDGTWCRGWYLDEARRFARMYPCRGALSDLHARDRALRADPGWAGWDVGVALDGIYAVRELAGDLPGRDDHGHLLDDWRGCAAARLYSLHDHETLFPHRWDPQTRTLRYRWYYPFDGIDIAIVDHDGLVLDYGFAEDTALFAALGHGQVLLDELATVPPCPGPFSTYGGAVIEVPRRTIYIWHEHLVGNGTLAALRVRWPGWHVERDRTGPIGYLHRTGRAHLLPERFADDDGYAAWAEVAPPTDEPTARAFLRLIEVGDGEL